MNAPYPLLLAPLLLPRVWGGCDLTPTTTPKSESLTGRDPAPIGEAWEVHDGVTVRNGRHVGSTLGALLHEDAATLLGPDVDASAGFPLLIKRLSVAAWLSLQVHPDDAQAACFENAPRGKEEAWVILAPKDGEAEFILGMREGVTTADLAAAIAAPARWDGLLRRVRARAGAVLHVPRARCTPSARASRSTRCSRIAISPIAFTIGGGWVWMADRAPCNPNAPSRSLALTIAQCRVTRRVKRPSCSRRRISARNGTESGVNGGWILAGGVATR